MRKQGKAIAIEAVTDTYVYFYILADMPRGLKTRIYCSWMNALIAEVLCPHMCTLAT